MSFLGLGSCKARGCGAFGGADPSKDTVHVEFPIEDKENVAPIGTRAERETKVGDVAHLAAEEEAREQLRLSEEEARKQAEELARREAEDRARREAEEKARREAEELARAEAERTALEQQKRREAEEAALEAHRKMMEVEEELRKRAEEEAAEKRRRAAEKQRLRDEEAAAVAGKEKVDSFLKAHGYAGVNVKRTKMMKTKYPLHSAVKHRDVEMIMLLLNAGANPFLTNSAGQTPQQLAQASKEHDLIAAFAAS